MTPLRINNPVKNTYMYLNTKGAIFSFFNSTMFDFIQFPLEPKHTVLIYVGDNLMNIKYIPQKKVPFRLQYSFLALLLLPFMPICTNVSKEEPRSIQQVRLA